MVKAVRGQIDGARTELITGSESQSWQAPLRDRKRGLQLELGDGGVEGCRVTGRLRLGFRPDSAAGARRAQAPSRPAKKRLRQAEIRR